MASGVIVGAIRFDAWYLNTSSSAISIAQLGPAQFQYRTPWFFNTYPGANLVDGSGDRQLVIDLEIGYAVAAGLNYWAFNQHASNSSLMVAWNFYQQSASKSQINWCWIADTATFEATSTSQYVTWFQQSNYQTVLTGRPLLFLLIGAGDNLTTLATAVSALRTAVTGAGLPTPYVVAMRGDAATGFSTMQTIGGDAISSYNAPVPAGTPSSYSALDASAQAFWAAMVATTAPTIPIAQMGWDVQPIYYPSLPPAWVTPGTVAQRAANIQEMVSFIKANPSGCPSTVGLIYSWTECSEGGGALIPTFGDPPSGAPPALNGILSAVKTVLS